VMSASAAPPGNSTSAVPVFLSSFWQAPRAQLRRPCRRQNSRMPGQRKLEARVQGHTLMPASRQDDPGGFNSFEQMRV
jgi:hypothetical protein